MIKLLINFLLLFFLFSCENIQKENISSIVDKSIEVVEKKIEVVKKKEPKILKKKNENIFYLVGEPYYIEGVKYIPEENYNYNKVGLATFYGKEFHNKKTANNDFNKVTELLGRHKTLPIPSVVKVTNLENGLFLTIKIVDRHYDNSSIIQVSRKVAQLLKFYKSKITKVRVEILADPSKQWKTVTMSMNDPIFNETIESAPTDLVSISNIDDNNIINNENISSEQPIEIGSESIEERDLFIKIYDFNNYEEIKKVIKNLNITEKSTSQKIGSKYILLIGPIKNEDANKLVSTFIMNGYKNTEIILK